MRVLLLKLLQCFVDQEHLLVGGGFCKIQLIEIDTLPIAAAFRASLSPGVLNQYSPHGFGGGRKKMATVLPGLLFGPHQSEPRLVNQGGCLECLTGGLAGEFVCREAAQFLIHQREKFGGGPSIALLNLFENARDIAHGHRLLHRSSGGTDKAICP